MSNGNTSVIKWIKANKFSVYCSSCAVILTSENVSIMGTASLGEGAKILYQQYNSQSEIFSANVNLINMLLPLPRNQYA